MRKNKVVITGVGRCGTSFFTEFLNNLDISTGGGNYYERFNAGLEYKQSIIINDLLIRAYNQGKRVNLEGIKNEIDNIEIDVFKDPKFLVVPENVIYWDIFVDLKFIWLTRDPKEIVESQKKASTMNCPAFRCFEDKIIEHEDRFQNVLNELNIPYIKIKYPDFVSNDQIFYKLLEWNVTRESVEHQRYIMKKTFNK